MRNRNQIKGILLAVLMFCGVVNAATYYVDADATEAGNGTINNPFSIAQAIGAGSTYGFLRGILPVVSGSIQPGDTVYLKGTFPFFNMRPNSTDWIGTEANPITVTNWPNYTATVRAIKFQSSSYIVWDNIDIIIPANSTTVSNSITFSAASNITIKNSTIGGQDVPADANKFPQYITFASSSPNPYATLDNCVIRNSQIGCDTIGAYTTIKNCEIYNVSGSAIKLGTSSSYYTVEDNQIHDQNELFGGGEDHGSGIAIRASNGVIRNNKFWRYGNTACIHSYQDIAPVNGYQNITIENNLVYYGLPAAQLGTISLIDVGNNIIVRNNTCFASYDANSTNVYADYESGFSFSFATNPGSDANAIQISNNIFVGNIYIGAADAGELATYRTLITDVNNIMWAVRYKSGGSADVLPYLTAGSNSLVACLNGTTLNEGFTDNYFQAAGPVFLGGTNGTAPLTDFQLKAGSPAIDFADITYSTVYDISGVARGAYPDAGAFEYVGSGVPDPVPPLAPSGLAATAISAAQVDVNWTDNSSDEDGFEIWRSTVAEDSNYILLASVAENVVAYSDTGLTASTQYWYKVLAISSTAANNSAFCTFATDTTDAATLPPVAVDANLVEYLSPVYLGDYAAGSIVTHKWRSNVVQGTIKIYKGINAVPYTTVTDIRGLGGLSGVNAIQLNTNDSFFEKAQDYTGIIVDANSGGSILDLIIFTFSIENRSTPSMATIENGFNSLGAQVYEVSGKVEEIDSTTRQSGKDIATIR